MVILLTYLKRLVQTSLQLEKRHVQRSHTSCALTHNAYLKCSVTNTLHLESISKKPARAADPKTYSGRAGMLSSGQ